MISDATVGALAIAAGLAAAWALIQMLQNWRRVKCWFGYHAPSGKFVPSVGARNVQRCLYCDKVVAEVKVSQGQVRRVR